MTFETQITPMNSKERMLEILVPSNLSKVNYKIIVMTKRRDISYKIKIDTTGY